MKINFRTPSHPLMSGGSTQQSNAKAPDWEPHYGRKEDVTYKNNIRFLLTDLSFHSVRLLLERAASSTDFADQHAAELEKEINSFTKNMEALIKLRQFEDARHFINMAKTTRDQYENNEQIGSYAHNLYCAATLIDCPSNTSLNDVASPHPSTKNWKELQRLKNLTKNLLEPDEPDVVTEHHFNKAAGAVCAGNPLDYIRISPVFRHAYLRLSAQGDYKPIRTGSNAPSIRAAAPI